MIKTIFRKYMESSEKARQLVFDYGSLNVAGPKYNPETGRDEPTDFDEQLECARNALLENLTEWFLMGLWEELEKEK